MEVVPIPPTSLILAGEYDSSPNPFRENSYAEGWNVLLRGTDDVPVAWNGCGAALFSGLESLDAFIDLAGTPSGNTFVKLGSGSASAWRNNSLFYIGSGHVFYGATPHFDTATSTLKVRLSDGTLLTVGLLAPTTAPMIEAIAGGTRLTGTRSICYTEYNALTGWESSRSEPSNVVTYLTGEKMRITIAGNHVTNSNITGRYLYSSPAGLGGLGEVTPFYRLNVGLVPISGAGGFSAAGVYEIDFNDTNLLVDFQAPVENDPPPAGGGLFVIAFDSIVVILGTYGGAGISPSDPNNSGVYNPLNTLFPYVVERILAVWPRAAAGYALAATRSSLFAVYPVGGAPGIACRPIWVNDGVPGGHKAGVFAKDAFFCYTQAGPAALAGSADTPQIAMNLPVRDEMRRNFDPLTCSAHYDPKDEEVVFVGRMTSGPLSGEWVGFPFRLGRRWGPKVVLPGKPEGSVELNGKLHLLIGGALVPWDTSGGGGLLGRGWLLRSGWMQLGVSDTRKKLRRVSSTANMAGVTCRLYKNLQLTNPVEWEAGAGVHGRAAKIRLIDAKSIAFEALGSVPGQRIDMTVFQGHTEGRFR